MARVVPGSPTQFSKNSGQHRNPLFEARAALEEVERARLAGKLDRAQSMCSALLKRHPQYVAALHTMGLVLADRGDFARALTYLVQASMHNPTDWTTLTALSGVYLRLGANIMAARTLELAREFNPSDASIFATLGAIYREEKEYVLSQHAFERALSIDPKFTVAENGLALSLVQMGQLDEAAARFEKLVRAGSRSINILYMLSQLPASCVTLDLFPLIEEAKRGPGEKEDEFRASIAFAKAAVLDKTGCYEEAWTHLLEGRRYSYERNRKAYQKERQRHQGLRDLAQKSPALAKSAAAASDQHPVSLFIAGPSRSGKTTLERLVGSLPGVKRGYENPIVENSVRRAFQTSGLLTSERPAEMPPALSDLFRKFYLEELRKRAGSVRVLTNTMPARIEDIYRVASEVPNVRIVFVKRDINDTSIRIFMRNYRAGNFYASDLRDIRDYLAWGHQMMDTMAEKLPLVSHVVRYEEIVADPVSALAKATALCDLPFDKRVVLPAVGDDRGAAIPYKDRMDAALRADDR